MCGIFGVVVARGALRPVDYLAKAAESLAHRGPDDSGTIVIPCGDDQQIGFAHTRLSIIDLSPSGHQPMTDAATGNAIVYNGEIYNFRALRSELEAAGAVFKSHSDTEVILAAYREWGEDCLARLDGMFAFALWDHAKRSLLLARDAMGIKPLYYYQSDQAFLFASEVRTLLKTGVVLGKADPAGVLSYLTFGSVYEPWTIIEGVKAAPAGSVMTLKHGKLSAREYWNPLNADREAAPSSSGIRPRQRAMKARNGTAEHLPTILRDAVLSHLVSDVPVGVFLSGGIDSSALVAVLSENGVRANTFSLVFGEREFDEGRYSSEVARRFRTEHHESTVTEQDLLAALPSAVAAMDQPTIDGVNTYLVSARARAAGVKVALTGLGADEMFGGYSNFHRVPKMEAFARRVGRLPKAARQRVAAPIAWFAGKGDRRRKLKELAQAGESAVHPYFLARSLFGAEERDQLFCSSERNESCEMLSQVLQDVLEECQGLDAVNRISYLEARCYMRNTLLRDSDSMSMAHGLELRVPFLDRRLVEACFRIPGEKKLEGARPKSLLLKSLPVPLPEEIVDRPKRGFTLPFERWLRGEIKPLMEEALKKNGWDGILVSGNAARAVWESFLAGQTSWSRPWSLFVLRRWCEQNL
jgi:asparagine synthase (glutamine-hydrolysing)